MKRFLSWFPRKGALVGVSVLSLGICVMSLNRWYPLLTEWADATIASFRKGTALVPDRDDHSNHEPHAGQDHDSHGGHDEASSLQLSPQGLRNIGLSEGTIRPVKLETFHRSISVPAIIVERPGRTRIQIATPMTGVVTYVGVVEGEAVHPGALLFRIRLTHEDLVNAQTQFLRTLGELDVEKREIVRLQGVTKSGAVAGKLLLEREYARDKLVAALQAQTEALKLHGLSDQQVEQIAAKRQLIRELLVYAPKFESHNSQLLRLAGNSSNAQFESDSTEINRESSSEHFGKLVLQALNVHTGESVNAGQTIGVLADLDLLFIEGLAFEQDIDLLRQASRKGWAVEAIFQRPGDQTSIVKGLKVAYLANTIDVDSRTLNFYVELPNQIANDRMRRGRSYIEWKYLPGQRLQLRVPVEEWHDQIVVPVEALAQEGAETYVFQQNGDHLDRVSVHVAYRDQQMAVIENDGSIFPGDNIALRGAHQLQMALKNKAGGGVDPHAGHNH